MAMKDGRKGKDHQRRADQVRKAVGDAVEETIGGAQQARERAVQVAEELSQSLVRFRDLVEGAAPAGASDLAALREELAALTARVEALERKPAPKRAPAAGRTGAARKTATTRASAAAGATTQAKAAAARTAAARRGGATSPGS